MEIVCLDIQMLFFCYNNDIGHLICMAAKKILSCKYPMVKIIDWRPQCLSFEICPWVSTKATWTALHQMNECGGDAKAEMFLRNRELLSHLILAQRLSATLWMVLQYLHLGGPEITWLLFVNFFPQNCILMGGYTVEFEVQE